MVNLTLIRPVNKGQGHSFGTDRFLIYDFLQAVNSNFCCRTHHLATVHTSQTTDDALYHKHHCTKYGRLKITKKTKSYWLFTAVTYARSEMFEYCKNSFYLKNSWIIPAWWPWRHSDDCKLGRKLKSVT